MTVKGYLITGALIGALAAFTEAAFSSPFMSGLAFGGGMLFGKGYGLWESRSHD